MYRLRRPFLLLFALALATPVAAHAQYGDAEASRKVDEIFERFGADTPGAAVLVLRDGEVLHRKGYGMANLEHGIPITASTVFDIASVSKQFGARAIAELVERGEIDLDDDIRSYLPELPDFGHTITVRHLVHHTSGIRDWPGALAVAGWRMDDVISFDQILRFASTQQDLNFVPGAEYSYSNTGYNILARLVERVSGQTFREWTEEHIFGPLGMSDTHFQDDHTEIVANRARGYMPSGGGYANFANGLTALGSSSLFTTADDLAKWTMNFDDGRNGGMAVVERMEQRGVLNDGEQIAYAYGQSIGDYHGLERWSHGGSWAGFRTVLMRFPEQRFGVIVLSNLGNFDPTGAAISIADIYLAGDVVETEDEAAATEEEPEAVAVDATTLDAYAGTYRLGPGWLVTITRDGDRLMTQATNENQFPMIAVSQEEFYVPAYNASFTFERSASGAVDIALYRGIRAPRVEPHAHTAAELNEYAGRYYSDELDTEYILSVRDGELVAWHQRHGDIGLTPILRDEFGGDEWFFQTVEFDRTAGRVTGLRVSNGRSRDLRFTRD